MGLTLGLLRSEPRLRWFFAAHAQSSIGTGAAYVALVLLAYERFQSPWAISLILLADFLPGALLGPLLGTAADRWHRRACMVAADLLRAGAFAAIVFAGSFELTLALAALAGTGTALYKPAALAALPGLVQRERLPAATSLYGAVTEVGFTTGPALAAGVMLVSGPELLLAVNAASFVISALVLARIPFAAQAAARTRPAVRASLLAETRQGLASLRGLRDVRSLLLVSAGLVAVVSLVNVGEMLLATESFGAGEAGFSVLVAASGVGIIAGSLLVARGGSAPMLKRLFVGSIAVQGAAFAAAGVTPAFFLAATAFLLAGFANGVEIASSRILIQTTVPDELLGRVFGVDNALVSAAFAAAFVAGGALVEAFGPRALTTGAGLATLGVFALALLSLRRAWPETAPAPAPVPAPAPAG